MNLLDRNAISLDNVIFSDESAFILNEKDNRQNCRYCLTRILTDCTKITPNTQKKVNVWVGIVNDGILGPIFIDDTLTGEKNLNLLQDELVPGIEDITLLPQQDGAPAHYALWDRQYLNEVFPNRWIGRKELIE